MKGGTTCARNGRLILPENARLPRNIQGSFTSRKSTTWDKRLYFPSEGRRAEDFFVLKNPTASAGFEPTNLGTKGQHATSRPPKPSTLLVTRILRWLPDIWRLCVLVAQVQTRPFHVMSAQRLRRPIGFKCHFLSLLSNVLQTNTKRLLPASNTFKFTVF